MGRGINQSLAVAAAALLLAACGGAGSGAMATQPAGAVDGQGAGYVPQSAGAMAVPGNAAASAAFPKPLPEPLIALGHGPSPDITSPIINDSGSYTNGPIIRATNTTTGYGMEGITDGSGAGVYGHAGSASITSYGVYGFSAGGAGLYGYASGSGNGVYGSSVNGYGVEGITANGGSLGGYFTNAGGGEALQASSSDSVGLEAISGTYIPIYAHTTGGSQAIYAYSNTGPTIQAAATKETGVWSTTGGTGDPESLAYYGNSGNGNGADLTGTYIGVVARAPAGTGTYPFLATDTGSNDLFWVDGSGDIYYHGSLNTFIATSHRGEATAYGPTSTSPTMEDTGSARLVNGSATVALDGAFAQTIDPQRTYQVMITPDGDTRGLYVASKSATAFVVREVQGGHGSLAFDYHIYATKLGHANERMTLISGGSSLAMPRAPEVTRKPAVPVLRTETRTH